MALTFSNIIDLISTTKKIRIVWSSDIIGDDVIIKVIDPVGTVLYLNSGYSTDDFSSPDTAPTDISEGSYSEYGNTGYPISGTYTIYYKLFSDKKEYSTSFVFCPDQLPVGELSMSHDCDLSKLTVDDITDYSILCNGTTVSPSSYANTEIVIKWPNTIPLVDRPANETTPGSQAGLQAINVENLWTGIFISTLSNDVYYNVTQTDLSQLQIQLQVTTIDTHNVVCLSDCACALLTCITAIYDRYIEATNPITKAQLEKAKNDLAFLMAELLLAIRCANESLASDICGKLTAIVNSVDCDCLNTVTSNVSVEIIPVNGTSGRVIRNDNIHMGNYPNVGSLASVGIVNDVAFDTSGTGNFYKKVAGTWILQGSLNGAAGSSTEKYVLENNDTTAVGTGAGVAEYKLKSLDVVTAKWGGVKSYLKYTVRLSLGVNSNKKGIRLEMTDGSITTDLCSFDIDWEITAANKYIDITFELTKTAAATNKGVLYISGVDFPIKTDYTFDTTATITLAVYGRNYIASANDVVCDQVKIENYKI